jgi:DNA-binding CsgD family transcriptional regulator
MALLGAVLDLRPFPTILMKPDLTVVHMTLATREAFAAGGIAVSQQGSLRLNEPGADERLNKALKALAAAQAPDHAPRFLAVDLAGKPQMLKIEAFRLPAAWGGPQRRKEALFALSIRESLRGPQIPPAWLAEALGLTASEAKLASALAEGLSLQGYAAREGLKIATARWHLQNVFQRTGARSQAGLVAMLVSLFS